MQTYEVPSWSWGTTLGGGTAAAVLDAADAANDLALAYSQAILLEEQAETAWQRATRTVDGEGPCRQAAAHAIGSAVAGYANTLLCLYARQALHLARVAAAALIAHVNGRPSSVEANSSVLPTSRLYADPTLIPEPPTNLDPPPDDPEEDLFQAYARVLDAVQIGRTISGGRGIDFVDPDRNADSGGDVLGMGLADLAQVLHRYGYLCLWRVAAGSRGC